MLPTSCLKDTELHKNSVAGAGVDGTFFGLLQSWATVWLFPHFSRVLGYLR